MNQPATKDKEEKCDMATLTKDALIELIRDKVGYPVKEAKEILEMILEEVKAKLEKGTEVKISGFGKWIVKEKRSRPGRNPHTGQKIEITARRVVTFHPSDKLRDCVNRQVPPTDLLNSRGGSDD
jgi:integration host factor subunit alpha